MAKVRTLSRLLRLRELEEEQSRLELELAVAARDRIEEERGRAELWRVGRREDFRASLGDRDTATRTGAIREMEMAGTLLARIEPRLQAAEAQLLRQRAEFLTRRTERRQVETMLANDRKLAATEATRRAQQILDDWYGRRSKDKDTPAAATKPRSRPGMSTSA